MKNVKILGTGCPNCQTTMRLVREVAGEKYVDVEIEKVDDIKKIVDFGVLATPAVVIDNIVVHAGGVPSREKIATWF